MTEFCFEELPDAPLLIDAIYKSGPDKNLKSEPLTRLFPKLANVGGFRKSLRADGSGLPGFVVIVTSDKEPEWPDYLDVENGIFRYYGDNRTAGKDIHDTQKKGNELLRDVFQWLGEGGESLKKIPPFFIFRRTGVRFDTQFLGLAVPGNNNIPPDRDLIAFWRTLGESVSRTMKHTLQFWIQKQRESAGNGFMLWWIIRKRVCSMLLWHGRVLLKREDMVSRL